jgi:glycosyltransferase involved in cell wall biosynthesis
MRVGVIVPVRAPAPYLAEALGSVLAQEPAPDAVVVVDDGSDPPLELGDEHAARVRLVRLGSAAGPAEARQMGLAELDTDLVALADADDVWEPGKLAAQLGALAAYPAAAVCFGRAVVVDGSGRPTGERLPEMPPGLQPGDELRASLFAQNVVPAASAVVRRDALVAVGGFAGGPALPAASDWELWLRLAAAGHPFVYEPLASIRYRRHAGALTSDVARLGEAGLAIHAAHAGMVDPDAARWARAQDLETLARGRVRQRRYAEAREALREAAALRPPGSRERLLRVLLTMPGARGLLGRRGPYR